MDEDLLINVPGFKETDPLTNRLNGTLHRPQDVQDGLDKTDTKCLLLRNVESCIQLGDLSQEAPYGKACLQYPEKCDYGISASVWVKFTENGFSKEVMLSTIGGYSQGFQFYVESGRLNLLVVGAVGRWLAQMDGFEKEVGRWRLLGFTWERSTHIIRFYMDSKVRTFYSSETYSEPNAQGAPAKFIHAGCEKSTSSAKSPLKAQLIHPAVWLWPIQEENLIILTGSLVYKLITYNVPTTTAVPTTQPKPDFAYSSIIKEFRYTQSQPNPYYELADFYLRPESVQANISADSNVTLRTDTIFGSTRGYVNLPRFFIRASPALFSYNNLDGRCVGDASLCTDGISFSVWLKFTQSLKTTDPMEFLKFNRFIVQVVNSTSYLVLNVISDVQSIQGIRIYAGRWFNLGVVFSSGSLRVYIDGMRQEISPNPASNTPITGSLHIGSQSQTAPIGLMLDDITVWYRALQEFELHRLLGYTADQLRYIRQADAYWTSDPFVISDSLALKNTPQYNFKSMYHVNIAGVNVMGTSISTDIDRFNKSDATSLNKNWYAHIFLGNDVSTRPNENTIMWYSECITDPYQSKCQINGLCLHMWVKIRSVDPTKKQFFFSSGDLAEARSSTLDSRGISLFTTGYLLGVSLSTDRKDWTLVIDSNRYRLNEWINIGFTWHDTHGMRLFLNGTDYGIRNLHPDISYKAYDKHIRAVVGRFDDDANTTWKGNSEWVMGDFSFSDIVFYDRWMSPAEFAAAIGSINNRYYVNADLLVWGQQIVSTPFKRLKEAKGNSLSIGPKGMVIGMNNYTKIASNGEVGINVMLAGECPRQLSSCSHKVLLNVWMKLLHKVNGTSLTALSLGSESDASEGFGVKIMGDDTLLAWVKRAGTTQKMTTKSSVKVRYGRWFNLGLQLDSQHSYPSVFLNGTNVSTQLRLESAVDPAYAVNTVAGVLKLGLKEARVNESEFMVFAVSGWYHKSLLATKISESLGIKSSHYNFISSADDYWTASGLWSKLQPRPMVPHNVELRRDKFDLEDGAMCALGSGGSYIELGDLQDSCLQNTGGCMAFILTLSIKPTMPTTPGKKYIFSSGGQNEGHLGTAISITEDGFIYATVRSPNQTRETVAPFNYSDWIQLQVRWFRDADIMIKVDEETISNRLETNRTHRMETNDNSTFTEGQIGKLNSNFTNAAEVCVSDIIFVFQPIGSNKELKADVGPLMCFEDQSVHAELYRTSVNFQDKANRSTSYAAETAVNIGTDACFFGGTECIRGATISFWLRVDSVDNSAEKQLLSTGYPSSKGFRVSIKKVSSSNHYHVKAEANFAGMTRTVETKSDEVKQAIGSWVNVGVNFVADMIELYFNGVRIAASTRSKSLALPNPSGSSIKIGSAGISILVSDFVVWNVPPINCQTPSTTKKLLTGSCNDVKADLATTCSSAESGGCESQIENNMCLDPKFENVHQIDLTGNLFASIPETKTVCKIITNTAQQNGVDKKFIKAGLNILERIGDNLDIADQIDSTNFGGIVDDISDAFTALMNKRFKDDYKKYVDSGEVKPAKLFKSFEDLSLKLANKLKTKCSPVPRTQGSIHWLAKKIDSSCADSTYNMLGYNQDTELQWGKSQDSLFLPNSLFTGPNPVEVGVTVYNNINHLLSSEATNTTTISKKTNTTIELVVNSKIISIITSLPKIVTDSLPDPLNITLELVDRNRKNDDELEYETKCAFWDTSDPSDFGGKWSTSGCVKLDEDELGVKCMCHHMTSFAILMQPVPTPEYNIHAQILSILTYILIAISLISLLVFIIVIIINKKLRGERYILHLNLAGALFIAQLAFILSKFAKDNVHFCKAVAVMMHLFFVATFALLLCESLWVFYAVTKGIIKGRLKFMLPIAWLFAIILVAVVGGIDGSAYGSQPYCWIKGVYIWAFLGPLVGLAALTLLVSLIVVCNLNTPAIKRKDILTDLRNHTHQCTYLIPLMILSWLFGVLLVQWYNIPIEYFFVIFNASQGFWVLLCFGLLNPDFREALCCKRSRGSVTSSSVTITGVQDISGSTSSFGSKTAIIPASGENKQAKRQMEQQPKRSAPVYHSGSGKGKGDSSDDEDQEGRNTSRTNLGSSSRSLRSSAAGSRRQLRDSQLDAERPATPRTETFTPPGATA